MPECIEEETNYQNSVTITSPPSLARARPNILLWNEHGRKWNIFSSKKKRGLDSPFFDKMFYFVIGPIDFNIVKC